MSTVATFRVKFSPFFSRDANRSISQGAQISLRIEFLSLEDGVPDKIKRATYCAIRFTSSCRIEGGTRHVVYEGSGETWDDPESHHSGNVELHVKDDEVTLTISF